MLIEVKVENRQGQIRFLPAGDVAKRLAEANHTQDLAPRLLNHAAGHLHAEVVVVEGNCPEAARMLAEFMTPVTIH
ncbi:hypothetical protein [Ralstonia mannitolilytica]|uniref:hypothetical protein n=1 Tax=Ralstonia mannitolilytica TaxID=105219 RepID=UPI00374A6F47